MEWINQVYYVVGIAAAIVTSIATPIVWVGKRFERARKSTEDFEEQHRVKTENMRDRIIVLESTKDHHNKRLDDLTDTTKSIWGAVSEMKSDIAKNQSELLLAIQGAKG